MFKFLSLILLTSSALAQTNYLEQSTVYRGVEAVNEHTTGSYCYVTISRVYEIDKGQHCYSSDVILSTHTDTGINNQVVNLNTRITNYHRREYPHKKTCAIGTDGTSYRDDIYSHETEGIYNKIFAGTHKEGSTQFDYFLTVHPDTKLASRFRVHILKPWLEKDIDCINLKLMN